MSINLLIEKITEQMQEEAEMQIRNQKKSFKLLPYHKLDTP